MLEQWKSVVVCCMSLGAAWCTGSHGEDAEVERPARARPLAADPESQPPPAPARGIRPVVDARFHFGFYGGDVPMIMSDGFGMEMDMAIGVEVSAGVKVGDRYAFTVGYGLADASATDELGLASLPQSLVQTVLRAEAYVPVARFGSASQGDIAISLLYTVDASLLDNNYDGWRDGTGFGVELAYCWRDESYPRAVFTRLGLGHRSLKFKEFEVTGLGAIDTDTSLTVNYFFASAELRF